MRVHMGHQVQLKEQAVNQQIHGFSGMPLCHVLEACDTG